MLPRVARSGPIGAILLLAGLLLRTSVTWAEEIPHFFVLCYHNIEDEAADQHYVGVTTRRLVEQLSWLERNDYHAVSVDDILAARSGRKPLPDKAYLITFDDGFESFYTRAFPILKAFNLPSVLAVEGNWAADTHGGPVDYAGESVARELFITWPQVREMVASGLVEIASHTMDLHRGIQGNPQGNLEPSAVTRRYDPAKGYETDDAYRKRIAADTETIARTIEHELGRRPRVMIWPYGEHSGLAISIQGARGMPMTMTLVDAPSVPEDLSQLPRHLIKDDPALGGFLQELHDLSGSGAMRAVQVDLDYVYDPDPAQTERNLSALVQHIRDLHISTVFLQAFSDPGGSGLVREVYFPNRLLPMRADLFNRAAWQLRTRAAVNVLAWLPVLAFEFGSEVGLSQHVLEWSDKTHRATVDETQYLRLSPFDATVRAKIVELYEDLAQHASIEGLLFHDDALLSDFEDASPAALIAYQAAGFPASIDAIRADRKLFQRWTSFKTDAIIQFTAELAQHVRFYRSPIMTVRNIYARPVLDRESVQWFAQDYDRFLASYDMVAVMAMPLMEGVARKDALAWLGRLVRQAKARPLGLKRTLFELQSVDWNRRSLATGHNLPSEDLAAQMRFLERQGALNFGYYPDDFLHNHPRAEVIHPVMSLQSHPYKEP
jgi:poly-beta-1,6-N-acetyl-D-glucosamine N-deacetylase